MSLFKKEKAKFVDRALYAVQHGDHKGQFFTIINEQLTPNTISVLFFPECETEYISKTDMESGLEGGVFTFVKKLPKDVYKQCVAEFKLRLIEKRTKEESTIHELDSRRNKSNT